MSTEFKNCQSCGMPLKSDPKGGATNADGSVSDRYCSYCFEKGEFTEPNFTVSQMQEHVKHKMKQMGFPGFVAGFFTKRIPKLERWKTQ